MIQSVVKSVFAYAKALTIINTLKLWKYFVIPILISVFTAIVIISLAYTFSGDIGGYIKTIWKWDFGKETFGVVSTFISGLLILALGLILYKHIIMALSAPFMSPVSEKIEKHLLGDKHEHRRTTNTEQLVRGIRINVRNLFKELFFTIPILMLGFIPVIGIVSSILLFFMQSFYAGFGNMDYTLERHFSYKESLSFVQRNKGIAIGNGIGFVLLSLIPIIGIIIVLPLSVTSATTETLKRIQEEL